MRRAACAEQAHAPVLGELELGDAFVHLVRLTQNEVARVGVLVVCPHVEGHAVRPKLPVEHGRVVRLGILRQRHGRPILVRWRGQFQRHPEVGVIAALQEEAVCRVGCDNLRVEAVLVVSRQARRLPAGRGAERGLQEVWA